LTGKFCNIHCGTAGNSVETNTTYALCVPLV
jgi:hypothetical protein